MLVGTKHLPKSYQITLKKILYLIHRDADIKYNERENQLDIAIYRLNKLYYTSTNMKKRTDVFFKNINIIGDNLEILER